MLGINHLVDGRNPANQLRLVVFPIIYRVLYIPGGCLGLSSINSLMLMRFSFAASLGPQTRSHLFQLHANVKTQNVRFGHKEPISFIGNDTHQMQGVGFMTPKLIAHKKIQRFQEIPRVKAFSIFLRSLGLIWIYSPIAFAIQRLQNLQAMALPRAASAGTLQRNHSRPREAGNTGHGTMVWLHLTS